MADIRIEKIRKFLMEYFDMLIFDSGSGEELKFPDFELNAYDYLDFAEEELDKETDASRINCISNLKRAIDCQLDTFLYVINLYNVFCKNNLKFATKLDFFKECDVFSSRSLVRLNTIRNKMEHEYNKPKINDIEVYYDLAVSFVSVLEKTILVLMTFTNMEFVFDEEYSPNGIFRIRYNVEKPSIIVQYSMIDQGKKSEETESFEVGIDEYKSFTYLFKVFLLLYESSETNRKQRILQSLSKEVL